MRALLARWQWAWQQAGWRGPVALAAALCVLAVLVDRLGAQPARERLERLQAAGNGPAAAAGPALPPAAAAALPAQLEDLGSLPAQLARLHQIAQAHGIALVQGQYKLQREPDSRLLQYQIVLPVRGSYVRLRRFIAAVLDAMPAMALDHVAFERKRADEDAVDAQMRFVLFLVDHEKER